MECVGVNSFILTTWKEDESFLSEVRKSYPSITCILSVPKGTKVKPTSVHLSIEVY